MLLLSAIRQIAKDVRFLRDNAGGTTTTTINNYSLESNVVTHHITDVNGQFFGVPTEFRLMGGKDPENYPVEYETADNFSEKTEALRLFTYNKTLKYGTIQLIVYALNEVGSYRHATEFYDVEEPDGSDDGEGYPYDYGIKRPKGLVIARLPDDCPTPVNDIVSISEQEGNWYTKINKGTREIKLYNNESFPGIFKVLLSGFFE